MRIIDPAQFLGARMHMHKWSLRARNVEQRVVLRRQFAQPTTDDDDKVGRFDPLEELGIGPDAEIASVARMGLIEQMTTTEGSADRQCIFFRKPRQAVASFLRPAAAATEHDRCTRRSKELGKFAHVGWTWRGL